jgi:predicted lactoylglutathione lyase
MAGIVFVRTHALAPLREFYLETMGMSVWLEQPGIAILSHENMLVGLQEADTTDRDSLLTFWFRSREEVDAMFERVRASALSPPRVNEQYQIYNFFATDPDGRRLECQAFLHPTPAVDGVPELPGA